MKQALDVAVESALRPFRSPTRRNRLPGRNRLRELASGRTSGRGPMLAPRPGLGPDQRMIGMLMVRDEADVLPVTLPLMTRWFDRIVVLDGSTTSDSISRSEAIFAATPEVAAVLYDRDLPIDHPTTDGCRQFLLDEIRQRWGVGNWVGVLHADEAWDTDPRPMVRLHNPRLDPVIRVRLIHAFLHPDDRHHFEDGDDDDRRSESELRSRINHYMWPGVPESRLFYDAGDRDYEVARHTKVVPTSMRTGPLHDGYWIVGYNERDPAQLKTRAADRLGTGWQRTHYQRVEDDTGVFVDSLHERSPIGTFDQAHHDPRYGRASVVTEAEINLAGRSREPIAVFVGGVGRTGSRLVRDLLAESPDAVAVPMEMKFISWPGGVVDLANCGSRHPSLRRLGRWWRQMFDFTPSPIPDELGGPTTNWGYRASLGLDRPPVGYREQVVHATRLLASGRLNDEDRRTVGRELTHWLLDRLVGTDQTHWVEQTPANVERADDLLATFPRARLINVIRDPRDVVASITRAWWGPDDPKQVAYNVVRAWQRWERFVGSSPNGERAELVRLEDLLADPDGACKTLWVAAGCRPAPTALDVAEPANTPAAFGDLDPSTRRSVEATLRPVLAGQGY